MRSGDRGAPNLLEQMGYETRDITLPRIFFWISVLFAFIVGALLLVWVLYSIFIPDYARLGQPSSIPLNRRLPPHPQLQVEPKRDMALYRTAEDSALNPEGVERAMNTLSEQGISGVRGQSAKSRGSAYPGSGNYVTPGGGETGNTNLLESSNDPQVGEKPLPGGADKKPGAGAEVPASGRGVPSAPPSQSEMSSEAGRNEATATPVPEANPSAE